MPTHEIATQVSPQRKAFDIKTVIYIVLAMLRRRWLVLAGSFVLALGIGAIGSGHLAEHVWKASMVLLYTAAPVPDTEAGLQTSLSLKNISGFVTSRPVLEKVHKDLALEFPVSLLESTIGFEQARLTSTIFVSIEWGDKDEAIEILEALTVAYPDFVAETRQNIAKSRLQELDRLVAAKTVEVTQARERLQQFARANRVVDFRQDLLTLMTDLGSLETVSQQVKRDEQSMHEQVKMLDQHLDELKKEQQKEAEESKEFEAATESLADNRRRQNRLRELIQDERLMIEVNAQLEVKRREYERARMLAQKHLIPKSKLEIIRGEVESLIAKITENRDITAWQSELEELDKLIVPTNNKRKTGSPIIAQILFKKLEIQLNIKHGQRTLLQCDRQIDEKREQIAVIQRTRSQFTGFEDEIESLSDERKGFAKEAAALRQLATLGACEFSVISPVSTGEYPVSSSRKKLFAGIFLAVIMLCGTTVAGYDALVCGIVPPIAQVEAMGLPVVSRLPSPGKLDDEDVTTLEAIRSLALEMRQLVRRPGAVFMVSALAEERSVKALIADLAICFADRDERVVIVDARIAQDGMGEFLTFADASQAVLHIQLETMDDYQDEAGPDYRLPGLRDWLSFYCDDVEQIVLPSNSAGIDLILPGASFDTEAFATVRMAELVQTLRETYSLVILLSPDTSEFVDVQVLAAHADGLLFTFYPGDRIEARNRETIKTLFDTGAPILGAIKV